MAKFIIVNTQCFEFEFKMSSGLIIADWLRTWVSFSKVKIAL